MIITRQDENRNGTDRSCSSLLIRANGQVVSANAWFYHFMAGNSSMSVVDLIAPEDGAYLKDFLEKLSSEGEEAENCKKQLPLEFLTSLENRLGQYLTNMYMRLDLSSHTENGVPLYRFTIIDMKEQKENLDNDKRLLTKYRYFMTLKNELYFEYRCTDENFVVYKYVSEKSVKFIDMNFRDFIAEMLSKYKADNSGIEAEINKFASLITESKGSIDTTIKLPLDEGREGEAFHVKGGSTVTDSNYVIGILIPELPEDQMPYYMTAAGRDAGTGILNKRAATEFAIDRLNQVGDGSAWMMVMDIDDFKNINDSYGHMFGDQVIRFVAETLQREIGYRGVVGRFGGDEYFALIDGRIETREELRVFIKTVVKEIAVEFDPKVNVTMSIGVSKYPENGRDFASLFAKADQAVYIAKEKGKNRHIIFDEELHGNMAKQDSVHNQSMAYALSKEKRRQMFTKLILGLSQNGADYLVKDKATQEMLRTLVDLDGVTVATDRGKKVLCRNGNYIVKNASLDTVFENEEYLKSFDEFGVMVENNYDRLKETMPEVYEQIKKMEVGASIQCIGKKDGLPYSIVCFDVFNRKRKWSDVDIDMLQMVGCILADQVCQ